MSVKLSVIVAPTFQGNFQKLMKEELPLKTAFKLKGILKTISSETEKYEEVRRSALTKYGKKKEDGSLDTDEQGNVKFDNEGAQAFVTDLNELLALDVEISTVSIAELGESVKMSLNDLLSLDGVVVE